ncbi:hypothetical protein GMDG_06227 [Pseudogymnoascus destructans 20631-21]|uniref:Uncharacterized protein n=1 Tax=Pseudogymnoascus destructans (strain ATCC MYA-4855 / 20631-21) TaxID=658429 RepID=L8FSN2_PSED2|nr:hypothetical protein GMDG_06227 [Pseudogymnoascus destructans 20631-21]
MSRVVLGASAPCVDCFMDETFHFWRSAQSISLLHQRVTSPTSAWRISLASILSNTVLQICASPRVVCMMHPWTFLSIQSANAWRWAAGDPEREGPASPNSQAVVGFRGAGLPLIRWATS